jgi:hypothetical protein
MNLQTAYAFILPAYDRRGELQVVVPVAARIIGDDVTELYPFIAQATAEQGYEITPQRWEHREVQYVQYVDES